MSESETRLRRVIEHAPIVLWAVDEKGTITLSEGKGLSALGLQPGETVGRSAFELYAGLPAVVSCLERGLAGEEFTATLEVGPTWLETHHTPIRDAAGKIVGLLGISLDVGARIQAEREGEQLHQQLLQRQKLESLGLLAGGIAHDFNNLLTAILGSTSAALHSLAAEHPAHHDLDNVTRAARRAANLTRQLLAYSGKGHFDVRRVDLTRHTRELTTLLETTIPKLVQLRMELAEGLPPIEADVGQLQQVLMNLVLNAAEAIGDERGTVLVTTGLLDVDRHYAATLWAQAPIEPGSYVYLEVHDTGGGMDEATQARIFDPFFSTKFTGRGLGLAAVQGIVRAHRGALKVYSTVGKGTTFKVLFPAAEGTATSSQNAMAAVQAFDGNALVVDDDPGVRNATRSMLELLGFTVDVAVHGRDGVDRVRADPARYAIVLLDMTMPEMSGEDAFREIRTLVPGARVILMSGYNEIEATRRFTTKGLAGFLQKPFSLADLSRKLAEAVPPR
jgi:two-component system cell cycle sensor histidine kinase/response regulator CckA